MECPFCNINSKDPQQIVLENKCCFFLQQPQEVLIGSGIIIPKQHRETVFDLTRNEWKATFVLLKQAKKLLDEKHNPDGYNVGWNAEETAGQEVFHAHLHVIPRYDDEPLAGKGIRYWIKQDLNKRK